MPALPILAGDVGFGRSFARYMGLPVEKAFVVAWDTSGPWQTGWGEGFSTSAEAIDRAMAQCNRQVAQRGLRAACRLFAVGDSVVWEER